MSRVPVAAPLAWTKPGQSFLQSVRFRREIGSDCPRCREFIR